MNFSNQIAFVKHYLSYVQPVIKNLMLFVWTSYQLYCGRITPCCHKKWNGYIVFFSCNIMYFVIGIMQRVFLEVWFLMICVPLYLCVCVFCVYMLFVYCQCIWPEIESYPFCTFLEDKCFCELCLCRCFPEAYSEPCQISTMEFFAKTFNTFFREQLWHGSEYASVLLFNGVS